jgi:hypothetical protein
MCAEKQPSQSTYEELRSSSEFTLNGVKVVRRSNLGPITVHSSGPAEDAKPSDSRISDELGKAIMDKYVESLKAGIEKATREQDQK